MKLILTKTKNGPELFIKYDRYDRNPALTQHFADMNIDPIQLKRGVSIHSQENIFTTLSAINTSTFENAHQKHEFIIKRSFFRRVRATNFLGFINYLFKPQNNLFTPMQISEFELLLKLNIAAIIHKTKQQLGPVETSWNKIKDLNLDTENPLLLHLKEQREKLGNIYQAEKEIYEKI